MLRQVSLRRAAWLGVSLLVALLFLSPPAPLFAASTRYISPSGTDAGNCLNSGAPCKTFTYAIAQASPGDTIRAAARLYVENVDINKNVTLQGASMDSTTIDGNLGGRVIRVEASVTAKLNALTLRGGKVIGHGGAGIYNLGTLTATSVNVNGNSVTGGSIPDDNGAGIYNLDTLTLKSSYVSNNHADNTGGGIYNAASAHLTLKGSTVIQNSAGGGGGIYNSGGTVNLTNVTLSGNSGSTAGGGGMYNSAGTATLTNVTFSGNTARDFGGGLVNFATATLTNVTFSGNLASTIAGGGISNAGTATLTNVTFNANSAAGKGGGIYNSSGGNVTLSSVTFAGNSTPGYGGGINTDSGTTNLTNVTLSSNSAQLGGGIYSNGGTANLTNVTLSGNAASNGGGGIYNNSGTLNLKNTIVANNPSGGNCQGPVAVTTQGHNLDSGSTCGFNIALKDKINVDPKLGPLQNNGGYTQTHALLKGSPAIDKGTNSGCPSTDQRGVARPRDGDGNGTSTCDIGAVEY